MLILHRINVKYEEADFQRHEVSAHLGISPLGND